MNIQELFSFSVKPSDFLAIMEFASDEKEKSLLKCLSLEVRDNFIYLIATDAKVLGVLSVGKTDKVKDYRFVIPVEFLNTLKPVLTALNKDKTFRKRDVIFKITVENLVSENNTANYNLLLANSVGLKLEEKHFISTELDNIKDSNNPYTFKSEKLTDRYPEVALVIPKQIKTETKELITYNFVTSFNPLLLNKIHNAVKLIDKDFKSLLFFREKNVFGLWGVHNNLYFILMEVRRPEDSLKEASKYPKWMTPFAKYYKDEK